MKYFRFHRRQAAFWLAAAFVAAVTVRVAEARPAPNRARVSTDRTAYAPEEVAVIGGSGFRAGEAVQLRVSHPDSQGSPTVAHGPWAATADGSGAIRSQWLVCDEAAPGTTLVLTARGSASGLEAQAAFSALAPSGEGLDGWLNRAQRWGGTIQENNSRYYENQTVPLRFVARLPAGSTHTLALRYDFTSGGKGYFFDYLESYGATEPGLDPVADLALRDPAAFWPIPADAGLPAGAQRPGVLTTYNVASVTGLDSRSYRLASGVKTLSFSFTVAGGTGDRLVVLVFGAHLASERVYGPGKGASQYPGASRKAYASLDGAASDNVSVNPGTILPVDDQPPTIECPGSLTQANDPGTCGARVVYTVNASDAASSVTVRCDPPSGAFFAVGTTVVRCTATDAAGNTATCSFPVTVLDVEGPTVTAPDLVGEPVVAGCSVGVPFTLSATDNCPGAVMLTHDGPADFRFAVGITPVRCEARDAAGNLTVATFNVSVPDAVNTSWPTAIDLSLASTGTPELLEGSAEQCLNSLDQSRWFRFKVQPGSRVAALLTGPPPEPGLPANYDLVLFGDIAQAYSALTGTDDLIRLNAEFAADAFSPAAFSADAFSPAAFSPAAFSPAAFSPAAFSPAAFSPAAFSPAAFSPAAFSPDAYAPAAFSPAAFSPDDFSPAAFSSAQLRSVIAASAFEGTAGEGIIANTWDSDGWFYVRVRGRNGAFQPHAPFHLTVYQLLGTCREVNPVVQDATGQPVVSELAAPAGGYQTLILTDSARLPGDAAAQAALRADLDRLAARPEVGGVVVDLAGDPLIAALQAQADRHFDCPYAKNLVAEAIRGVIDRSRSGNALRHLVLAGDDSAIPFYRYPDQALLGPEKNYIPPVKDTTASQASLRFNHVLSQDYYGARCEISRKTSALPLADLTVGRLVGHPAQMQRLIQAYLGTPDGVVRPASALVTGYDFLTDAANAVRAELEAGLGTAAESLLVDPAVPPTLVPPTWTADDLRARLFARRHDLIFLAGHFSAVGALAADYRTFLRASELATQPVPFAWQNVLLFSAGCHSGYNIVDADGIPGVTLEPDWAEACAAQQITLVAGTGYQYGDTDFLEYSERLYLEFARELRSGVGPVAVGEALQRAKRTYLASTPRLRGIHEKAVLEVTLFGLPMLRFDLPGQRRPESSLDSIVSDPAPAPSGPGATLGLRYADRCLTPTLTRNTVVLDDFENGTQVAATYFSGAQGVVSNPAEPTLPVEAYNAAVPGTVLRGVGFREATYEDLPDVLPLTGAATTEIRGVHVSFLSDVFYPMQPWSLNYFDAVCGDPGADTRLVLMPGQFASDPSATSRGTQRLFRNLCFRLYYSANTEVRHDPVLGVSGQPGLAAPPSIAGVRGITTWGDPEAGDHVALSAYVTGSPLAGIQEVWVTYTATSGPYAGRWQSLDLAPSQTDLARWEGRLPLAGTPPQDIRYLVQAVNGVGLVAIDLKHGAYHVPDETDGLTGAPTQVALLSPPATGVYNSPSSFSARLTVEGAPVAGVQLRFTLGDQGVTGITDADGVARVTFAVRSVPADYELNALFPGNSTLAASFATSPFSVLKQATTLTIEASSSWVRAGVDPGIAAMLLESTGAPILERTVVFVLEGPVAATAVGITDFNGRAALGPVALPDGTYSVSAYFGGSLELPPSGERVTLADDRYLPAVTSGTIMVDTTPPLVQSVTANPATLGPPNHKMVPVRLTVSATDNGALGQARVVEVTSDEPINGLGDGDQTPDWEITGDLAVSLRAERAENDRFGRGRTYTLTVEVSDAAGNRARGKTAVYVPQ